jgi:glycosyltransferase involved in cell wall biosynthesis
MTAPRVSILMPVRESRFLDPAMATILGQTLDDFELVAVADGADAGTRARLAAHAAADRRIRILRRDRSAGLAAALNAGLAECRAPLVARADADDLYRPDRLARQVRAFEARPGLAALSCGWRRVDAAGRALFTHRPPTGPAILRFQVMFASPLLHPGVMFRAGAVRDLGGYDPAFWTAQDADLWARMAAAGAELDNLPEPLVDWRRHDGSVSARRGAEGRALSMSVRARQHAAYLGAPQPDFLVAASVDTLVAAAPLSLAEISAGERQLARFLARARRVEPPEVVTHLRRAAAAALLRQSRWALRTGRPVAAARLGRRAAAWHADRGVEAAAPLDRTGAAAA